MPAHRKHPDTLVMSGAIKKIQQRFRDRKSASKPIGELGKPPKHLSEEERKTWKEMASKIPPGTQI
jgi:hypothetical protein